MSTDNAPVTKADLAANLQALEQRLEKRFEQLTHYIDERTRDMQTELLRGFRSYQESTSVRMAKLTADVSNIDTSTDRRIAIVEERLTELERRIAQKGL